MLAGLTAIVEPALCPLSRRQRSSCISAARLAFALPTALAGTSRPLATLSQKPLHSQPLRGVLVDHDVLHGGEALLDGIVGALRYRVGVHQPQLPVNGYLCVNIYLVAEFARA